MPSTVVERRGFEPRTSCLQSVLALVKADANRRHSTPVFLV